MILISKSVCNFYFMKNKTNSRAFSSEYFNLTTEMSDS